MDDRNTCSCYEFGSLAHCTAMACDPSKRKKRLNDQCVPETYFKKERNDCFCSENAHAQCTKMGCEEMLASDLVLKNQELAVAAELQYIRQRTLSMN